MTTKLFSKMGAAGLLACAAFVFMSSGTAFAQETLTLTSGASTGMGTCDASGLCFFSGAVGQWDINVTTGLSYTILGSTAAPDMTLISTDATKVTTPTALKISFSDTGYTTSPIDLLPAVGGTNNSNATSVAFSFLDNGTPFATYTGDGTSYKATGPAVVISPTTPYSLTLQEVITGSSGPNQNANPTMTLSTLAPEPSFYAILALGMVGLFVVARRKRADA